MITLEQTWVFVVLAATLALFVWDRWRYDVIAVLALLAVVMGGVITPEQAFSGFGHPAVITVAAVLIISRTLQNSGLIGWLSRFLGRADFGPEVQVAVIAGLVAALSAFMNNVGALALLMPVVLQTAKRTGRSTGELLMPLAFGSLLGGLVTLIGTPPNIIIAAYRAEYAGQPFAMFDFTPVGLTVALVGLGFVATVGWRLIPQREDAPGHPEELFRIDNYITEVIVPRKTTLIGETIGEMLEDAGEEGVAVVALLRRGKRHLAPRLDQTLQANDHLLLEADATEIEALVEATSLTPVGTRALEPGAFDSDTMGLMEAVVTPQSRMTGRTSGQARLGAHYGLNLLAIARHGRPVRERLNRVRFRPGDVVLLQGDLEALPDTLAQLGCLPLARREIALDRAPSLLPLVIFAAAIGASTSGLVSVPVAFVATVAAFVVTGLITLREVYESVEWPVVVLLAAMIPVGEALEISGATGLIAAGVAALAAYLPAAALLVLVMVIAMVLSAVINNAATAVLMAPLAAQIATRIEVNSDPFLMAVAIGSSCAFLTPIGHQSNVLVMGPGGYRFGDYWQMGLPLEALIVLVATPTILFVWPL